MTNYASIEEQAKKVEAESIRLLDEFPFTAYATQRTLFGGDPIATGGSIVTSLLYEISELKKRVAALEGESNNE